MATNFPASLDTLTNPTSSDSLSSPSHSAQHANVNDAVEALQAKVGADSSAVTSSLDYKVADHASRLTTLESAPAPTGGLVYITKATLSGASVSFDNVFDSTYENYVIVMSDVSASASVGMYFRLRASSSDAAFTRYYWHQHEGQYNSSAYQGRNGSGVTYFHVLPQVQGNTTDVAATTITVYQPALAKYTGINHDGYEANVGRNIVKGAGFYQNTTVFDGFSLVLTSGTFSSGTCFVYGLATS